jgi:hypothetical protein
MTHDELLIEINRRLDVALYNGDAQSIHALRAVVELHNCSNKYCGNCGMASPCFTIQAIQKELV